MYFIPSAQKETEFKKITIEQFYYILNNNFNKSFIDVLKQNNTKNIFLTNFDKEILLLQIHLNEIKETNIQNKTILHPDTQFINDELYNIQINVPYINRELEYCETILKLNKNDKDLLLLLEISKHITSLIIKNVSFNCNGSLLELADNLKKLPPSILAKCVSCIDIFKKQIKTYFKQNNINYKYNIDLLVP